MLSGSWVPSPTPQAPACLHSALFIGWLWLWAWWERRERSQQPSPTASPCAGLCLSSAGVAAGVEGALLRGQAAKEGVEQGLGQCDALGGVELQHPPHQVEQLHVLQGVL